MANVRIAVGISTFAAMSRLFDSVSNMVDNGVIDQHRRA